MIQFSTRDDLRKRFNLRKSFTQLLCFLALVLSADVAITEQLVPADVGVEKLPRVVSINLCTDQLIMALAQPEQIVALSSLSREKAGSYFHDLANDYPQAEPTAEDLLSLAPDIVVTGPYTSRYTLKLLAELDIRVEILPIANSFKEMLANIDALGKILKQQRRAESMIDKVQQRLAAIALSSDTQVSDTQVSGSSRRAAVFDANGYTVGRQTMRGEVIELGGWSNVASEAGIATYGVLGLEQLISLRPHTIIESPYSADTYSRGQILSRHPAIRTSGLNPQIIRIPSNQTLCAGPWTLLAVERLIAAHL